MNLQDILERRSAVQAEMRTIYDAAESEGRDLSADEAGRWEALRNEERSLSDRERRARERMELDRNQDGGTPHGERRAMEAGEVRALRPEQRMAELSRTDGPALSLGRMLRGTILGDWTGAQEEMRAMSTTTASAGGYLVPDSISANVIDLARNAAVAIQAGGLTIPMPTQKMTVVRITTDPTAGWRSEGGAITESDGGFEPITLEARSLAALVRVNIELLEDVPAFQNIIEAQIAAALALELDRAALFGSGTAPEPRGLFNTTGINEVDMGTNGAALGDYDPFLDAIQKIEDNNLTPAAAIYAPRTKRALSGLTTGISGDKTKLPAPPEFTALRRFTTNQVPVNMTKGTATNASTALVGDFAQMAVAIRSNLVIEASRTAGDTFSKAQVLIRAIMRADVAVMRPKAFTRIIGIKPA